jgi:hypothetical protein
MSSSVTAAPSRAAPAARALPPYLAGVTVDDLSDLAGLISAARRLPVKPVIRLYLDVTQPPSAYAAAVRALRPDSYLMGELLDSSDETHISVAALGRRVKSFLRLFGHSVDIWEIGNEVNGSWTGPYPVVSAKLVTAYRLVAAGGSPTALTLYYNHDCGDGPGELDPLAFSRRFVPADVRRGLRYVFISYYEDECGFRRPSVAVWQRFFVSLHQLYPDARLGFGEVGLTTPVTSRLVRYARAEIAYYYGLPIRLPYYVGGYFWWYYAEDRQRLAAAIASGFRAEAAALGHRGRPPR